MPGENTISLGIYSNKVTHDTHSIFEKDKFQWTIPVAGKYCLEVFYKAKLEYGQNLFSSYMIKNGEKLEQSVFTAAYYKAINNDAMEFVVQYKYEPPGSFLAGDVVTIPEHMRDVLHFKFNRIASPIHYEVSKESYKLSGDIYLTTPGTYKIGDETVKLESGTLIVKLDNRHVQKDGTIKIPFELVTR